MNDTKKQNFYIQVGFDHTLLKKEGASSDTLTRQRFYASILREHDPRAILVCIVLNCHEKYNPIFENNLWIIPTNATKLSRYIKALRILRELEKQGNIKVVSSQSPFEDGWISKLFCQKRNIPFLVQLHSDFFSDGFKEEKPLLNRLRLAYAKSILKKATAIRVVSEKIREKVLNIAGEKKVKVLPVYVSFKAQERQKTPERQVLFVGRLVPAKNLFLWLKVAKRVLEKTKAGFLIVGDGPLRKKLEEEAEFLKISESVKFVGNIPYRDLPKVYARSTVFLLTSKYEGFGRVLVESYLSGVPAVATNIAGPADIIINGETGFIHETDDLEGIATSVLKLLEDEKLNWQMGEMGRKYVREKFSPEKLAKGWVKFLWETSRRS